MEFILKIFKYIFGEKLEKHSLSKYYNDKKYSNTKYSTSPIKFKNKNIVYPNNKTEKEIEALYSEIRELQAKNRDKINKNKFVYFSR